MKKTLWLMVFVALTAFGCTQARTNAQAPIETQVSSFAPQRFVPVTAELPSVEGLRPFDLALDTKTGRICKTWTWKLAGDTELNSLPECYRIYRAEIRELKKKIEELSGASSSK